jgi:hypothetical protein
MQPEQGQDAGLRNGKAGGQPAGHAVAAPQFGGPGAPQAVGQPGGGNGVPQAAGQSAPRPGGQGVPKPGGQGVPKPGGQKMFRLPGATVAWWAWVIFAVACLVDISFTGRDHTAAEIAVTLVFITGLIYACALWPRVVTDAAAVTVRNPLRDHRIPWGSVAAVDLRESVQVHCVKEPGAKRAKVVHSWALYAQRRNRLRSELLAQGAHGDRRRLPRTSLDPFGGSQAGAQKITKQSAAELMATQLDEMAKEARERGAAAGPRVVGWSWQPAVAIAAPAVALVLVILLLR